MWLIETMAAGNVERAEAMAGAPELDRRLGDRPLLLGVRGSVRLATGRYRAAVADFMGGGPSRAAEDLSSPVVMRYGAWASLAAYADRSPGLARTLIGEEESDALRRGAPVRIAWPATCAPSLTRGCP